MDAILKKLASHIMPHLFWKMMVYIPTIGWCSTMANLLRMNEEELEIAKNIITAECIFHRKGDCLWLDHGYCSVCPQLISYSVNCKYFRREILPHHNDLLKSILQHNKKGFCRICGNPITSTSPNAKYCKDCSKHQRRKRIRNRVRKHRKNTRNVTLLD